MNSETVIKFEDVSFHYPQAKIWALKHINLEIKKGEFIAIMGQNGAGKTTFCQTINGIIPQSQSGVFKGKVTVADYDTNETPVSVLASKVGMVLEDPETQFFTSLIRSEVAFGPENLKIPKDEVLRRVKWALDVVRLTEYKDGEPSALSGGQKQRLAIACALAMLPGIMVLDEPTSQLDPIGTREVFSVIRKLREEMNMTILIATHKSEEIAEFADRILILNHGEAIAFDTPEKIFSDKKLIDDNWIRAPQISSVASWLEDKGDPLKHFPILLEDAGKEVIQWLGKGGK